MRYLVLDSSTIINLALNNLLWILEPLRRQYGGEFYITPEVKKEIVDVPLTIKRFKLEAMQILDEITKGNIKIYDKEDLSAETEELSRIANQIFIGKKNYMKVIDEGELSAIVLARKIQADALIIDERTTRLLIESPNMLTLLFRKKLHTNIQVEQKNLKAFAQKAGALPILRSVELGVAAYEMGILDKYIPQEKRAKKELQKELLDGLLWGMKLKGCAVSEKEMEEILKEELKQ